MRAFKTFVQILVLFLWALTALAQDLAQLSAEPYKTVDDVAESIRRYTDYYDARDDRREIFVRIYQRITDEAQRLIGTGRFEHDFWIESLVVNFADEYRKAVLASAVGDEASLPVPWKLDFDHAEARDLALSTQLVLALNAHILYDLPRTLVAIADPKEGLAPYKRDFFLMNGIFKSIMEDMFTIFYTELDYPSARLRHPVERLKRKIVFGMLKKMRRTAWKRARKLMALSDPGAREAYIETISRKTMRTNRIIMSLNYFLSVGPGELLPLQLKAIEDSIAEE